MSYDIALAAGIMFCVSLFITWGEYVIWEFLAPEDDKTIVHGQARRVHRMRRK